MSTIGEDAGITNGPGWKWVSAASMAAFAFFASLFLHDIRSQLVEVNENVLNLRLTIVRLEENRKSAEATHLALAERISALSQSIEVVSLKASDRWSRSDMRNWSRELMRKNKTLEMPTIE